MRRLIKTDGTEHELPTKLSIPEVEKLIGATGSGLGTVQLRHLREPVQVMLLDDLGHSKGLPLNPKACALYWANCRPGTTHPIVGDVVIVPDEDFA